MHLAPIDVVLIVIYGVFVLAIGFLLRRQMVGSSEFFLAGRSMPAWVAGLAFLSANLGAQEMIGMAASGAYAMGALLALLLGWNINASITVSAVVVLLYIALGGLTSAIYNEVLQFFLIVFGFAPVAYLGLRDLGGWQGVAARVPDTFTHAWSNLGSAGANPMGVEWFGMVMGLGFVLSFGYWCTDFLVVQRAMAADSMSAARRTPLIAAVPKLLFPFLIIVPGIVALALTLQPQPGTQPLLPTLPNGTHDYNMALPLMMARYYPAGLLGLGLTALLASFMSGMAGNVTAFNTVWTFDIYQSYVRPRESDAHYLWMGRMATVFGVLMSIATAYAAMRFNNIMDMLQRVFSFVNAPLFATFLLGMFWKRTTGHGAFWGLAAGTAAAALHYEVTAVTGAASLLPKLAVLHEYPSDMAQNFWGAIVAWTTCFVATGAISLATVAKPDAELRGLVFGLTERSTSEEARWHHRPAVLAGIVLTLTAALNVVFW
jgi:SSS family solute:Na+ symporter